MLWHEGELDVEGGFPVAAWAGCLESIISAWRARYGSSIPLIVGTFTYAQQRNPAAYYTVRACAVFVFFSSCSTLPCALPISYHQFARAGLHALPVRAGALRRAAGRARHAGWPGRRLQARTGRPLRFAVLCVTRSHPNARPPAATR